MSSLSAANFPPPNVDQHSYYPSNPGTYPIRIPPVDPAHSQRLHTPASNFLATTPPQPGVAPPMPATTPPQLRGVPPNSPHQLNTIPPDSGARQNQYLASPSYRTDPRPPSQEGRNYFADSAVAPDYRGLNYPPYNGPQNGPNSLQPPSPVNPSQFTWPNSSSLSPNTALQQHPGPQMAAHSERRFSPPQLYLQPPPPLRSASFPQNYPSIIERRSFENLGVQDRARSLDVMSISAPGPNPPMVEQSSRRSPPMQTQTPMNMYTRYAQNNKPNVAPSGLSNIFTNGRGQNGYSNTQNGPPNIPQNGPSNIPPNGHSNMAYQSQLDVVQNGASNISGNVPIVAANSQSNMPKNSQPNITYNGQQNTTPNRTSNSNGSTGSSRSRKNSESELPAGVFWTTWDWIDKNFYGIDESITPLGRGSYGKVFEVVDLNSKLKYAMKIMEDTAKQREELTTVQQLCTGANSKRSHPHIVHVFKTMRIKDSEEKQSPRLGIQMELCAGSLFGLLSAAKSSRKNLEANTILCILIQILDGLHYCHSRNIIHRDLKPQNGLIPLYKFSLSVLYVERACVCHPEHSERSFLLTDFGFAKPCLEDNGISSAKHGSNSYRSPELMKANQYSEKSDIWAFGCVVMEVASSGKVVAFTDDYLARMYNEGAKGFELPQLKREDNTALDESSIRYFNSLVKSCFQRDPKFRPSAKELLSSLEMRQFIIGFAGAN